ncbi:MAG: hypothetical protein H6618_09525 [Deltaproteobacteria bacterium]|nr:hypothetical protein [Deltaproteobacteria bacterium]
MSESAGYTREQLKNLKEAYASGVLEFRFGSEKTVYRSGKEMLEAIRIIERDLGVAQKPRMRAVIPTFGKGL